MQGGTRVESAKELQTLVLKQKSFSKYYEILYFEMFHNRSNKFTIQIFPCINICCSDFANGEFKWFDLYTTMSSTIQREKCGTLMVSQSTCMIQ